MAKYFGMKQNTVMLLVLLLAFGWWGTAGFTQPFSLGTQAISPGGGAAQPPGEIVGGTFDVATLGAGTSDVDGRSGQVSIGSEGCADTKTTDVYLRLEESIKSSTGSVTYVGGSVTLYDAGTKTPVGAAITLSDQGTATTTDPACGQEVYAIYTNTSMGSAKYGPFKVGGARTTLRMVADVAGTPVIEVQNVSGAWTANTNMSVGASTTDTSVMFRLKTSTARGVLLSPHLAVSADLTANWTSFYPNAATEVACPIRISAQTAQELKCFNPNAGKQVTVNSVGPAVTITRISGTLAPTEGAVDGNLAPLITAYDTGCYVLNNDLVCGVGETNAHADILAGDDTAGVSS